MEFWKAERPLQTPVVSVLRTVWKQEQRQLNHSSHQLQGANFPQPYVTQKLSFTALKLSTKVID